MRKKYLKDLHTMVLQILKDFPKSRDSDAWLTIKLWCIFFPSRIKFDQATLKKFVFLEDILLDLPKEDQIKRHRALIQNNKKNPRYLPTNWGVAKQRKISQDVWTEYTKQEPLL